MKEIKRFLEGEEIPDNARYLYSTTELDKENRRTERSIRSGPFGLWFTEYEKNITPRKVVHYYEVNCD